MKTIQRVGVAVLLGLTTLQTFAIEGLQISVQCSNVCLTWPSIEGKNYIVQYRQTLNPSDTWQTLTSAWPAVAGTNFTSFVHSNVVQNPSCGCGGTSFAAMASSGNRLSAARAVAEIMPPVPMAIPVNGSGGGVPLALYPPGFDLSGFLIFDPATGETLSGAGYTVTASSPLTARLSGDGSSPTPMGGPVPDGGSGGTLAEPETGFYRVVQDGVKILDSSLNVLTNGALSNSVAIGFEAGNAANDGTGTNVLGDIESADLIVDGVKFPGDGVLSIADGDPFHFAMDTAYLENGDHTLQVEVTWFDAYNTDPNNIFPTRASDPVTITVSNAIYYPQWEEDVGEAGVSAYFLKTTCTNADWWIQIYDVSNKLAQTLTGHTDDGIIEAYWNMVDTNGVTRTNADVDPEFSAMVTVGDPVTAQTPAKKQRKNTWPDHAVWTVSYLDYFKHEYSDNNWMQASVNDVALTAQKYGGYWIYYPQPGQTNDIGQTYPLRFQNAYHPEDNVTADQITKDSALLTYFLANTNSRNFFYKGHGGPDALCYLTSRQIAASVKHRYRFVMLLACDTANGNLDKAFHINGPGQFDLTHYQNTGMRPAAFCAYSTQTYRSFNYIQPDGSGGYYVNGIKYDGVIPWQVPAFLTQFLFYWDSDLGNRTLTDAIQTARDSLPPVNGFPIQPGENLQIYGYPQLRIDEFNHRGDWP